MLRFFFYFVFAAFVTCSCSETEPESTGVDVCKGKNPTERLAWLKQKTTELQASVGKGSCTDNGGGCVYIARGTVGGETVFEIGNCCPNVNSIPGFFKCDGSSFCDYKDINCPTQSEIQDREIIWRTPSL